ncbi:F-box/kelch-repeat protein At3g23880-like [Prunus avium]|uniref:F-box/kelch-repeat protein At3g23880-like n=1 Tax=Prunus avium TaxID=42229 RepID=A0A6P5RXH0_PRUAV|nr:F-box/kelch-repeat protein At3g23880-like [Prunus avium]XP_021806416.1 F-box/kelch-repeat protein At3g23880-like [Prunus avium]XP_021806417.1 F-box/kelch-repeat protein At3g23880-like [Prunus avium]XP_021806418.1 F-box/kelch-repeat protein At3g23880-like [Prunus avium]
MDNIQDITQGIHELKFEAMAHSFPEEIIQEILLRLSVKCLIKCTSVCKAWRSMIINQSFIHAHLNPTVDFAIQNDIDLLLLHRISGGCSLTYYHNKFFHEVIHEVKDEVHSVHHDNQAFDVYSKIEFPIVAKKNYGNSHLRVVGTCDGLICLSDDVPSYAYNFIIWNPAIKKSVTLPKPGITYQTHGGHNASIGFGFDATTNDYKVVRVVTLLDEDDETPTVAEVYSLATGTWRSLGCVSPACLIDKAASSAFVNGVLHWPVARQTYVGSYYIILTFDLGKEVFSQIPMPKIILWNFKLGLQLSVSDNRKSIALFMRPDDREDFYMDYGREYPVLDIWVMKEYGREESWTKLITLSLNPQPQGPETIFLSTLCFRKTGEVLLVLREKERRELVSLDLVSKQFKLLGISGFKYCTVDFYKESLLLLDKSDAESY